MSKTTQSKKASTEANGTMPRVYPGFPYKLKATFSYSAIALTDSLFAVPGEPPTTMENGEVYEISGNGISKKETLHFIDRVPGEALLKQYKCSPNRMNESMIYEVWSASF